MDNNDFFGQILKFISELFSKGDVPVISKTIELDPVAPTPTPVAPVYKVTKEELLMGRDKEYAIEYTDQISANLDALLVPINKIRDAYGKPMKCNSGWRPPEINASTPGAATHSKHMEGLAADFSDPDGEFMKWVLQNLQLMYDLNIFMEDFRWTPNWVHFQLGEPKSGKRIFIPSTAAPGAPDKWNGIYDHSFDIKAT